MGNDNELDDPGGCECDYGPCDYHVAMDNLRYEAQEKVKELELSVSCQTSMAEGLMRELKDAGFGKYGEPNTLAGMVRHCVRVAKELKKDNEKVALHNKALKNELARAKKDVRILAKRPPQELGLLEANKLLNQTINECNASIRESEKSIAKLRKQLGIKPGEPALNLQLDEGE